jgi:hypothetical protein
MTPVHNALVTRPAVSPRLTRPRSMRTRFPRRVLLAGVACLLVTTLCSAQSVPRGQLGPAPRVTDPAQLAAGGGGPLPDGLSPVDRTNRQAVVDFYTGVYVAALAVPNDWTGSVAGCNAGVTSTAYANATMDMVNYYRAMTGLPAGVTHEAAKDGKAQLAALMMTANNSLSHAPPSTWTCYTADGAEAAGKSNLALGAAGARAVALYMADPGTGNTALGHRRWILYPRQVEMGTGSTGNANDLWVIGAFGSRSATPAVVAWPPAGFVPYQLIYPRWSFSVNTSVTVSFSGATVSMTRGGVPVTLTVFAGATGYGDNTLAWETSDLGFSSGGADEDVSVQVNNVVVNGVPTNYAYTVTVIDPARVPAPVFTDNPLLPRTTLVKAVHVTELRQAIDALRARYALSAFPWADAMLTPRASVVRAAHVVELRDALNGVYAAARRTPPSYSALVAKVTAIRAADVAELRAAVLAIW